MKTPKNLHLALPLMRINPAGHAQIGAQQCIQTSFQKSQNPHDKSSFPYKLAIYQDTIPERSPFQGPLYKQKAAHTPKVTISSLNSGILNSVRNPGELKVPGYIFYERGIRLCQNSFRKQSKAERRPPPPRRCANVTPESNQNPNRMIFMSYCLSGRKNLSLPILTPPLPLGGVQLCQPIHR